MMPSQPPVSRFFKIKVWISDVIAVPRRVRRIAHALDQERDPRPICRSCGSGRIGSLRPSRDIFVVSIGACSKCGAQFSVDENGAVGRLLETRRQA